MSDKSPNPTKTLQQMEEELVQYWKEHKTFEKSIEMRPADDAFSFIDGPPFVTGSPHYGSLLPSIAKDVIPRYQTMKGKRVRRVWGWDCHGLPIEEKVNKLFGIKSSTELENKLGVERYVQECRKYVESASSDWRWYIERIGRWVDLDNAYYTMHPKFMESVIWAFKQIYDKGLIYKGKRVSLFSTDTSTPVSGFEVSMDPDNYQDVDDLSIFTKFELENPEKLTADGKPVYMVAWTTTPWTIPANFALAVNEKFTYVLVEYDNELLIVAKERMEYTFGESVHLVKVLKEMSGKELEGLKYKPVYDFFVETKTDKDFTVYLSDDVTSDDGTGVLHIAPAFGEVDFNMGKKHGLSAIADIDDEGNMTVGPWQGVYLRDASPLVTEDLQKKGNLLRSEIYRHRLPFYRGKNPLIYMAQEAYFIDIQKIKARMLELNAEINWIPEHIGSGRSKNVIETSPDWCISRNRYWATIMPIWKAEDGDEIVIGSFEEMTQYTDQVVKRGDTYFYGDQPMDLHRDVCDKIVLKKDGKEYHRIPEVLDCWMDSGSVPFAEYHYPFENQKAFENGVPADYIIEYVGQVRAWFNMLLRLSTMLFDKTAFTNVVCTGVLAGNDGRKMSKSYGNYPDPKATIEKYGGDALRLYFMSSPIMIGDDLNISETDIADQVKSVLNIYWNSYKYYQTYASGEVGTIVDSELTLMDRWILARLKETTFTIGTALDEYHMPRATRAIRPFVDDLSTWYIRRSRNRIANGDKTALAVLKHVLIEFSKAASPIIPFITENVFRGLSHEESVHLTDYPKYEALSAEESALLEKMKQVRDVSSMGQAARLQAKVALKQPLSRIILRFEKDTGLSDEYLAIIREELNVKQVVLNEDIPATCVGMVEQGLALGLDTTLTEELKVEGKYREILRSLQELRKTKGLQVSDEIELTWFSNDEMVKKAFDVYGDEMKKPLKVTHFVVAHEQGALEKIGKEDLSVFLVKI